MSSALRAWTESRWPRGVDWFRLDEPRALKTPDGSIFRWEPFADGTRRLLEFTWRHPHASLPTIQWSTRVTFAVLPQRLYATICVGNTGPDLTDPGGLPTTRPRLLLMLCDRFEVRTRGVNLQLAPQAIGSDDFPSFVRYELFDPHRDYPVLLLTPTAEDKYVVSPEAFGREFVGIAKTYYARSASSTFVLTDELGRKDLSCFHGAMRLYMPGFSRESRPANHPLLLPRRLALPSERLRLAQVLTTVTVSSYAEEPFVAELRDERAVAQDTKRTALLSSLEGAKKEALDGNDFRQLAELYSQQNSQLLAEVDRLRDALEDANHKVTALQYALAQRTVEPAASDFSAVAFPPADVADAVEQADTLFPDDLLILPSALRSAEASPYRNPAEVAMALAELAKLAQALRSGSLGKKLQDYLSERGLDYGGGLSPTTSKKLRQQYRSADNDREYSWEEHIRIGGGSYDPADSLRIYFNSRERPNGRIVIGHVGRHLDVMSTS